MSFHYKIEVPMVDFKQVGLNSQATSELRECLHKQMSDFYEKLSIRNKVAVKCFQNILRSHGVEIQMICISFDIKSTTINLGKKCLAQVVKNLVKKNKNTNITSWWKNLYSCRKSNEVYLEYFLGVFSTIDDLLRQHVVIELTRVAIFCEMGATLPNETFELHGKTSKWMTKLVEKRIRPILFHRYKNDYNLVYRKDISIREMFPTPNSVQHWSIERVEKWVTSLSLENCAQYAQKFKELQIDGNRLNSLVLDELIHYFGPSLQAKLIYNGIIELKQSHLIIEFVSKWKRLSSSKVDLNHPNTKVSQDPDPDMNNPLATLNIMIGYSARVEKENTQLKKENDILRNQKEDIDKELQSKLEEIEDLKRENEDLKRENSVARDQIQMEIPDAHDYQYFKKEDMENQSDHQSDHTMGDESDASMGSTGSMGPMGPIVHVKNDQYEPCPTFSSALPSGLPSSGLPSGLPSVLPSLPSSSLPSSSLPSALFTVPPQFAPLPLSSPLPFPTTHIPNFIPERNDSQLIINELNEENQKLKERIFEYEKYIDQVHQHYLQLQQRCQTYENVLFDKMDNFG